MLAGAAYAGNFFMQLWGAYPEVSPVERQNALVFQFATNLIR